MSRRARQPGDSRFSEKAVSRTGLRSVSAPRSHTWQAQLSEWRRESAPLFPRSSVRCRARRPREPSSPWDASYRSEPPSHPSARVCSASCSRRATGGNRRPSERPSLGSPSSPPSGFVFVSSRPPRPSSARSVPRCSRPRRWKLRQELRIGTPDRLLATGARGYEGGRRPDPLLEEAYVVPGLRRQFLESGHARRS